MSQTTVNRLIPIAIPGMAADIGINHVTTKRADADLGIAIGLVEGTAFTDVVTPADVISQVFKGFSVQSHDRENQTVGVDSAIYQEDEAVNVATFGAFWIIYSGTPVLGTAVILAVDAGNEGKVTDTGGGNTVAATGWFFQEVDTITGLARISTRG